MDGTTPAIVRDVCDEDLPTRRSRFSAGESDNIVNCIRNTVTNKPGFGDAGYRVQTVTHDCPLNPEFRNEVRYWCLNPNCVHFVSAMRVTPNGSGE